MNTRTGALLRAGPFGLTVGLTVGTTIGLTNWRASAVRGVQAEGTRAPLTDDEEQLHDPFITSRPATERPGRFIVDGPWCCEC